MALAGTVSEVIGLTATFLVAGLAPPVLGLVAIVAARMPADETAHPLDVPGREREPDSNDELHAPVPLLEPALDRV